MKKYLLSIVLIELIIWLLGTILVLFGVFEHLNYFARTNPSNTSFVYADGYIYDYYQIMSWIRQGKNGEILLLNRYTDEPVKPILIHPFYPLLGFITKPIDVSPFVLFTCARIIGTLIFLASFACLLRNIFPVSKIRILTALLFFTGTSFWTLEKVGSSFRYLEPVTGSLYFNVIGKFFLSPHHILALSCLFFILAFLTGKRPIRSPFHSVVLLTIIGGFLNPSLFLLFLAIIFLCGIVLVITKPKNYKLFVFNSLFILIPGAIVILYHFYHFQNTPPWTTWYRHMLSYKPYVYFWDYIKALGPVFLLSFFSVLSPWRKEKWFPLFVFWTYLPLVFYFLKDSKLPFSYERIVQSYQYIPLSILGALAIDGISLRLSFLFQKRQKILHQIILIGFSLFFMSFALLPYIFTVKGERNFWSPGVYNVFIPNQGIHAFSYLEKNTPKGSVVLAGEAISNMIPAFTENRVILGRSDATENYAVKQTRAYAFLDGKLTQQEALQFLKDYHISHLLLGIDTIPFHGSKVENYPFLEEVFREDYVSVLRVRP